MSRNITMREAVAGDGQQLKKDMPYHGTTMKEDSIECDYVGVCDKGAIPVYIRWLWQVSQVYGRSRPLR